MERDSVPITVLDSRVGLRSNRRGRGPLVPGSPGGLAQRNKRRIHADRPVRLERGGNLRNGREVPALQRFVAAPWLGRFCLRPSRTSLIQVSLNRSWTIDAMGMREQGGTR